jgi:hypothetical protein
MEGEVTITGIGLWARGLHNWDEYCSAAHSGYANLDVDFVAPTPNAIPARERRRSPLLIRLAVEVMHQACDMAGVDKSTIASVFSSAMGDVDITDYMCRKLASEEKMLSPTRFHNSVHNAPSGYWAISAKNREPSSFVGGFKESFAAGFLEAATMSISEARPVVLAAYDLKACTPLAEICSITEPFGCALVIDSSPDIDRGWPVQIVHQKDSVTDPGCKHAYIHSQMNSNPAARCLPLLDAFARECPADVAWPTGSTTSLRVRYLKNKSA